MTLDLCAFLAEPSVPVFRPQAPVAIEYRITAIQHALALAERFPVVYVEKPLMADGTESAMPVVTNVFASRELNARVLGIADHRRAAATFASSIAQKAIPPVVVGQAQAPVQAMVKEGDAANVLALPVLRQNAFDVAPYLTAAHISTFDPDSGIDNTSIQRLAVHDKRFMTFHAFGATHNAMNIRKFWAKGEACPVAVWIGHHPAISIGSQAKLGYPESHWATAGGMAGEAVRLVPSITHGEKLMIPADAEIVIEGWVPPNRHAADGPLAEYHGYMGLQIACPTMDVTCMTHRPDAIYQDCGAGLHDHLICENLPIEGKIYSLVKAVAPSLVNVHLPFSGRRFNTYLQFENPRAGEVRDALAAALGFRRHRTVIAVDEDIDIFDDSQIMWALATRVQWHRDMVTFDGLSYPPHDPSLPPGAKTITKAAIDATLPPAPGSGLPRPFAPPIAVDEDALRAAEALLDGVDSTNWPRA